MLEFARTRVVTTPELNRAVAATLFGESSRAIASPKDLEAENTFVWGKDYPEEAYYYAAWILYRVDRYFARTPEVSTLKAAKYHVAMIVSAFVNPHLVPLFEAADPDVVAQQLLKPKKFRFRVADKAVFEDIEIEIASAVDLTATFFQSVLDEGRSLRKDDVRSRRSQEALVQKVKVLTEK